MSVGQASMRDYGVLEYDMTGEKWRRGLTYLRSKTRLDIYHIRHSVRSRSPDRNKDDAAIIRGRFDISGRS